MVTIYILDFGISRKKKQKTESSSLATPTRTRPFTCGSAIASKQQAALVLLAAKLLPACMGAN